MRFLKSLQQPIFVAKYLGREEITKTVGKREIRTGDYRLKFGEIQTAMMYKSVARRGEAELGGDGLSTENNVHSLYSETDLGLEPEDLVWTGVADIPPESIEPYENGFYLDGGVLVPWESKEPVNGGLISPWTIGEEKFYRIIRVENSPHHAVYRVTEV